VLDRIGYEAGDFHSDPHHLIGYGLGGTGTKASDIFLFPLRRSRHIKLHEDPLKWEADNNLTQLECVILTIHMAIDHNIYTRGFALEKISDQMVNQDHLDIILGEFG
jgi:hypothetical protein